MKKGKLLMAVLSGVLVGSLFCAGSVFADNDSDQTSGAAVGWERPGRGFGGKGIGFMATGQEEWQKILDQLVAQGTITQAKADQILDFCAQKVEEKKNAVDEEKKEGESKKTGAGFLTGAVDDGVITQEEADAIQENWQKARETQGEKRSPGAFREKMTDTRFSALVEAGIISQDKADKLQAYLQEQGQERKSEAGQQPREGILSQLVDEGIITQEEADAIQEQIEEYMDTKQAEMRKEQFSGLVDEGIISQDKADELNEFLTQQEEERKARLEELKDMTPEERKAALEEKSGDESDRKDGFLAAAVEEEIITQEEADAIQEQWQKDREAQREEMMDQQLAQLVEDEIISQEQADGMKEFIENKSVELKAQMDQVKNMTEEEREAFFAENKKDGLNILDEMVAAGIITQDQAEKITLKMPGHTGFGRGNFSAPPNEQE